MVPGMSETWRDRLKQELKRQDISLRQLSIKVGLSDGFAKILLKRETQPSVKNFFAIADALGVSPVWLYTGKEDPDTDLNGLTLEQRQLVLAIVKELKAKRPSIDQDFQFLAPDHQDVVRQMIATLKDKALGDG